MRWTTSIAIIAGPVPARYPPALLPVALRKEVGFGCPVPGCGNPYLRWHHFDPPWDVEQHHRLDGMVALCGEHHAKADAGAFTNEQLHEFKARGLRHAGEVKGRFDWMRRELLGVAGSNFGYQSGVLISYKSTPLIWISRDEEGFLMVNVRMLTTTGEPRAEIEDNFWVSRGDPEDVECPPSGRLLHVKYANGDMVRVEFFELPSLGDAVRRYPDARADQWGIPFPLTAVEVHLKVGGTPIEIGPRFTRFPGFFGQNNFARGYGTILNIN